jgi:hypothetical protein
MTFRVNVFDVFDFFRNDKSNVSSFPHYDYLADIQDSLKEFDEGNAIDILILLGEELVETSCHGIIERAFKSLGGNIKGKFTDLTFPITSINKFFVLTLYRIDCITRWCV